MMRLFAIAAAMAVLAGQVSAQDAAGPAIDLPLDKGLAVDSLTYWPSYIEAAGPAATLITGKVAAGAAIITIPYRYKHPLRLKTPVRTFLKSIDAGAPGFDAGDFSGAIGVEPVMCFFRPNSPNGYALPECLRYVGMMGVGWATAQVDSNLPAMFQAGDPAGTPDVDRDVAIEHDFKLILSVKAWKKKVVRLTWTSDGRTVGGYSLPVNADGTATLKLMTGVLTLAPDPASKDGTIVDFASDAPALP